MKRLIVLIGLTLSLTGCGALENAGHQTFASMVKTDRRITLYAADGSILKIWQGRFNLDSEGGMIYFVDKGKAIVVNGTFTVEEI